MIACKRCGRDIAAHKWSKIRAGDEGWFFQNNGDAWCPAHVPEWVAGWRFRRALTRDE